MTDTPTRVEKLEAALAELIDWSPPMHQQDPAYHDVIRRSTRVLLDPTPDTPQERVEAARVDLAERLEARAKHAEWDADSGMRSKYDASIRAEALRDAAQMARDESSTEGWASDNDPELVEMWSRAAQSEGGEEARRLRAAIEEHRRKMGGTVYEDEAHACWQKATTRLWDALRPASPSPTEQEGARVDCLRCEHPISFHTADGCLGDLSKCPCEGFSNYEPASDSEQEGSA